MYIAHANPFLMFCYPEELDLKLINGVRGDSNSKQYINNHIYHIRKVNSAVFLAVRLQLVATNETFYSTARLTSQLPAADLC